MSSQYRSPALPQGASHLRPSRSHSRLDVDTEEIEEYVSKARSLSLRKPGASRRGSLFSSLLSSVGLSTRRRRVHVATRCTVVLVFLVGAFVVLDFLDELVFQGGSGKSTANSVPRSRASHRPRPPKHARKTDFLEQWLRFQGHHPQNASDRLSFAEVGFQTAVYEQAMHSVHALGEDRLKEIEATLYPWMHNLDAIRRLHVGKRNLNDAGSSGVTHHQPTNPGIIIVAGNNQFRYTVELINTIRKGHRCDISIEVFFFGSEDLSTERQDFLSDNFERVRPVDLSRVGYFDESFAKLKHGTWAMKPYAMMATAFTEVMLLDADCILLADPHDFFHQPDYRETGTLFFQDRLMPDLTFDEMQTWFKNQLGDRVPSPTLQGSPFWEQGLRHRGESGLVLLNKADAGVFATLLFILWQNSGDVRSAMTYVLFYGDKETFWAAFELAGIPYYMSPYWAGAIGPEHAKHLDGFCSDHILHFFDAPVVHNASASVGLDYRHTLKERQRQPRHNVASDDADDIDGEEVDRHVMHDNAKEDFVEVESAVTGSGSNARVVAGRPAWLNGALRNNKLFDDEDGVMDYATSIWTMDGDWEWREVPAGGQSICKANYTRHSMDELSMGPVMPAILQAGQEAIDLILKHLESDH